MPVQSAATPASYTFIIHIKKRRKNQLVLNIITIGWRELFKKLASAAIISGSLALKASKSTMAPETAALLT